MKGVVIMKYVPDFARKTGKAVWKNKGYVAVIPLATLAGWGVSHGIDYLSDSSVVNYIGSLVPQTAAAVTGGVASVKIAEDYRGRKLNAGEKALAFTAGALACAGLCKGVENLNSIPAVNDYLAGFGIGLEKDFPSKHRPEDIGVATGLALAARYGFEGAKEGVKKAFKRKV